MMNILIVSIVLSIFKPGVSFTLSSLTPIITRPSFHGVSKAIDNITTKRSIISSSELKMSSMSPMLVEPTQRDSHYGSNVAQYLLDLHDSKATFNFCGGMMFQLVLSEKLRHHLQNVSKNNKEQPVIFDKLKSRMYNLDNYSQNANADNKRIFHGREIRQVPNAAGGMGFVLQLSYADANGSDPEGWTTEEVKGYDGWAHDVSRTWRKADRYEREGFDTFIERFGSKAFGLNHRFYLHFDSANRMWLSAEDGCEGTPQISSNGGLFRLFG